LAGAAERAKDLGDRESSSAFLGTSAALAEQLRRAWPRAVPLPAWAREVNVAAEGFAPQQLRDLAQLVRAMGTRDSLASLFHQTLDSMLLWTGAERGVLMTTWQDKLVIRCARNIERDNLEGEQLRLSQSLAARALRTREPVIATDAASQTEDERASVHALALRSVLAVPLIARGEPCGVVYLDDKTRIGAFGERELAWVRLLAAHAASAIVDARDQVMLRRALRTARRAEAHLQRVLAEREAELVATKAALSTETRYAYRDLIGRGQAMTRLLKLLDRLTDSTIPVLLVGESGTGKELVARALHDNGPRSKAAFVAQNCAAIPEGLLESALFGHVRGAFTGATQSQLGLFEVAHGGTLFLDEIGEMPLSTQVRLLRVLQEGEVRPVGANHLRKVDVRIIGATHRDLEALVKSGQFREDLYYRLHVVTARVPALRERREDMPDLIAHFLTKYVPSGAAPPRLDPRAMQCLLQYSWPGNVRQLENELRRALVLSEGVVDVEHFSDAVRSALPIELPTPTAENLTRAAPSPRDAEDLRPLREQIDDLERHAVRLALQACQGNQTRMAERLGISRFGLNKMMKRLGLR
jgi:transcriptional regulator with GAF, ATPase, and Fis domain